VPHTLRGDRVPLLDELQDKQAFADFAADMKERADLEDARLQYVTLTRAKNRLVMSSHWWGRTQKKPLPPSDLLEQLREYCEQSELHGEVDYWCPPPVEETNPALVDKLEVSWPPGPADPEAQQRRRAAADAVLERMRGAVARPAERSGEALGSIGGLGYTDEDGPRDEDAPPDDEYPEDDQVPDDDLDPEDRKLVEGWDRDIEALLGELRRAREVRQEVRLPRALSTTRLLALVADPSGFAEELFRPMPRRPAATARRGTEFHAWVEQRFGQLPLFDELDLGLADDEELAGADDLAELKESFLAGEFAEREPYRIEAPFQMLLGGQIVRGRIDAVYRTADGGFDVVDWKTNRAETADPMQLAVYRLAWAEFAGVPIEQVTAAFVYVRTGTVRRYADLPGREGLERMIRQRAAAGA